MHDTHYESTTRALARRRRGLLQRLHRRPRHHDFDGDPPPTPACIALPPRHTRVDALPWRQFHRDSRLA